jgi:hypothetical protein
MDKQFPAKIIRAINNPKTAPIFHHPLIVLTFEKQFFAAVHAHGTRVKKAISVVLVALEKNRAAHKVLETICQCACSMVSVFPCFHETPLTQALFSSSSGRRHRSHAKRKAPSLRASPSVRPTTHPHPLSLNLFSHTHGSKQVKFRQFQSETHT